MNSISVLFFIFVSIGNAFGQLGVGNSMLPEVHATALIPMLTGTNVPESEEEIEAPIYDEHEVEKIKELAKNTIEHAKDPENAPIVGNFLKSHPGFMSTVESIRIDETDDDVIEVTSSTEAPAFPLGGHPTLSTVIGLSTTVGTTSSGTTTPSISTIGISTSGITTTIGISTEKPSGVTGTTTVSSGTSSPSSNH